MTYDYPGSELELFAAAKNWKSYFSRLLAPYVRGRVLEVGGGLGANIAYLHNHLVREWISLELDGVMSEEVASRIACRDLPASCRAVRGTIDDVPLEPTFDTILYIDVLEHIADDAGELVKAVDRLAPSGTLLVLSPAHQFLFSPFDAAIGHYRRYTSTTLKAISPPNSELIHCAMLDSVGFFASLANRLLLRSNMPSIDQIALWDKRLVPVSVVLDKAIGFKFGKTIIMIWRRTTT